MRAYIHVYVCVCVLNPTSETESPDVGGCLGMCVCVCVAYTLLLRPAGPVVWKRVKLFDAFCEYVYIKLCRNLGSAAALSPLSVKRNSHITVINTS